MAKLEQFLQLFNPLPGNHYLQVTTIPDDTTLALSTLMSKVDGELNLVIYGDDKELESPFLDMKIQYVDSLEKPFRAVPRDHDIVVLKDIFNQHLNQKMLLKIAYTTLANTADIVIMEKKGTMDIEMIKGLLEEFEFRASNDIDLHPEYDLVMAKKMHMWGNGL